MLLKEHRKISNRLKKYSDIERLSKTTKYEEDLLLVLYTQKVVRKATARFYKVKSRSQALHRLWKNGKSIYAIAKHIDFPPVLLGLIILSEEGISRKMYRNFLNDLDRAPTPRLKRELAQVAKKDHIYSPEGYDIQTERGRKSELAINDWLREHGVKFRIEAELRNQYPKTPDFLLDKPINVRGTDISWIESKGTFGDTHEIQKNLRSQLQPYREMFGCGMVIYWYGFITPSPLTDGILIESKEFLNEWEE
ncbi:MAG: TPD domain-containing protein [Thermoplasmata archaeon]|nr:MAG: TPD domain-containing protein [Thermoplasmata archaeon]